MSEVTNAMILDALMELKQQLTRIEAKVDALSLELKATAAELAMITARRDSTPPSRH